jgi:N-methylhydantoinase A
MGPAAGVDVGGTFTDVVVSGAGGAPSVVKVPTTADDQSVAVRDGLVAACGPGTWPALVAHGTTTATNAVLERRVARTVLVTTAGFADLLVIARQNRPALYDLSVVRPEPLVPADLVVTVRERSSPDGVVVALDDVEVERVVEAVAALAAESVAVSLLFAYARPAHEQRLCDALAARLGVPVTRSSELLPEFREYERTSTCVLNAAVAPVMGTYLGRLADRVDPAQVLVMTSGGGTARLDQVGAAPVHTLLSGPAAGVVAAAAVARSAGFADAVAFDMGGTSTDVCLVRGGVPEVSTDGEIGGLPFRTPSVAIHTVGAGGGSLGWIDAGGALRVGPRSAGAVPGPACYGLGGTEPTVTDAHCALGHLAAGRELGGGLRLDVDAARAALGRLPGAPEEAARDMLRVVQAAMVRALRRVTTEQGVDPAGLALVAYGGAGPLHATALARELGCAAVVIPPTPGVLSALGLLLAPARTERSRTVAAPANAELDAVWGELEEQAADEIGRGAVVARVADCRYRGQSHELRLNVDAGEDLAAAFHAAHEQAYGYAMPGEPVEVVTVRAVATGRPVLDALPTGWDLGERGGLRAGATVAGPALIEQPDSTTLLQEGERAEVDAAGNLVVRW